MSHNLSRFENSGSACAILANSDSIIATNADILPLVNKALDSVVTRNQKKDLAVELLAVYSSQEPYNRLGNNVDKLSALIESADRSPSERHAMVTLLSSMLMDYNSDVATQLPKVLTKLVGVACRLVAKEDSSSSQYGLHILRIFAEYKARPIMLPHAKQVRQACVQLMSAGTGNWSSEYIDLIAEVYALYASMEPAENWSTIWVEAVQECTALAGVLGIGASNNGLAGAAKKATKKGGPGTDGSAVSPLALFTASDVLQLRGVAKALRVQQLFQCGAAILTQLLRVGCSSGFVALNVTGFLPLLQLVLSANADVNVKDPVSYIEGEAGVAPVDVALVLSLLKVDLLSTVTTLLNLDHPALVRIGTSLVRPVAALLTRPEGKGAVPRLQRALLRCVAASARALPSVTAASVNSTPIGLLELLQSEVQDLTANQALLSQTQATSDAKKENSREAANTDGNLSFSTGVSSTAPVNLTGVVISSISGTMDSTTARFELESDRAERLTVLFEICEAVLLHCGPLLSASVRESFTTAVHQGLSCLAQGVLVPQFADRHVHRYAGARLRQDLTAQRLLLQLATVEVFSPPQLQQQTQQFSRNLPLLKRCAELCLRNAVTAGVAARVLLQVSTLLHPVTVALPAVPAIDTARSYILSASEALPLSASAPSSAVQPAHMELVASEDNPVHGEECGMKRAVDSAVSASGAEDASGSPAKRPKTSDFAGGRSVSESKAKAAPQTATGAGRRASLDSVPKATTAAPSVLSAATMSAATSNKPSAAATSGKATAEDDDESLPDIDIDADPDSD